MNIFKNFLIFGVLLGLTYTANAATYTITGGNWEGAEEWNSHATGLPHSKVYDNGEMPSEPVINNQTFLGLIWENGDQNFSGGPIVQTGTYSGLITTDGAGNVIAGTLTVTGPISWEVQPTANSWWLIQYSDLTIDFSSGTATASAHACYEAQLYSQVIGPALCSDALLVYDSSKFWAPLAGNLGAAGQSASAATFNSVSSVLTIFHEGYDGVTGSDYRQTLTLSVVPIPAALWLFTSALLGLGWVKHKT